MLPDSIQNLLRLTSRTLDALSEWTGRIVAWLVLAMTLLVAYDVAMRYLMDAGSVGLQELEWHLFALIFLIGAGYTLLHEDHVRIDLFYESRWMNDTGRAWVRLVGGIVLLVPFCLLVIYWSWPFVHDAWLFGEGSPDPGGLPARWILKAAIPTGFTLLLLQGVADIARQALVLFGDRREDR